MEREKEDWIEEGGCPETRQVLCMLSCNCFSNQKNVHLHIANVAKLY